MKVRYRISIWVSPSVLFDIPDCFPDFLPQAHQLGVAVIDLVFNSTMRTIASSTDDSCFEGEDLCFSEIMGDTKVA